MPDEIKTVETAATAKVDGFFAKQVAWVKANPIRAAVYVVGALSFIDVILRQVL